MHCKAKKFGDNTAAKALMSLNEAASAKAIGAKIKNFDSEVWKQVCDGYMSKGLTTKFSQNEELKTFLKGTGKKSLLGET